MAELGGPRLPDDLLAGLRALEDVPGISMTGAWQREGSRLMNECTITIDAESEFVASTTRWVIITTDAYPAGTLIFARAPNGGVRGDFPNELPILKNLPAELQQPRPCLITRTQALGRWDADPEPHDAFSRLAWHAVRLVRWLEKAAAGTLLGPGDPFGHPQIHHVDTTHSINTFEDAASLTGWRSSLGAHGDVRLHSDERGHHARFAVEFLRGGVGLLKPMWGSWVEALPEAPKGHWLLLKRPPFIAPWGFPATWGELRECVREQGINVDDVLRSALVHNKTTAPIFMLGYPVPDTVGGPDVKIEWQACELPAISRFSKVVKGFRDHPRSRWLRARWELLNDAQRITWLHSANHQPSELGSRGFLPGSIRDQRFVLIGAGALGSAIAEHLVRTGVVHLAVIDHDSIQTRNLVRHTLTLDDVPGNKAQRLARRLERITTLARPVGFAEPFPPQGSEATEALQRADVIIDATASDRVLADLGQLRWAEPKVVISLSLAWRAAALYAYAERTKRFNALAYRKAVGPHVHLDLSRTSQEPTTMDGIGCWDPVWPALHTDVQLLAAVGAKFVRDFLQRDVASLLRVYEQVDDSSGFEGVRLRMEPNT